MGIVQKNILQFLYFLITNLDAGEQVVLLSTIAGLVPSLEFKIIKNKCLNALLSAKLKTAESILMKMF